MQISYNKLKKKLLKMGEEVSHPMNKSYTIRFNSEQKLRKAVKILKYVDHTRAYSSGYPLTLNFDR